jgi:hypothetical protein
MTVVIIVVDVCIAAAAVVVAARVFDERKSALRWMFDIPFRRAD